MARSNAKRQAAYRQRHLKDPDGGLERLSLMVSLPTKRKLERLAACYGITQRRLLEEVLAEAERRALDALPAEAQADYYDKLPTVLRRNGDGGRGGS